MMSAITPAMLSSSTTNQASIKPVPPTNPPASPIGLANLPKISTTSSPTTSPNKPNVSVNHSSVPLSLVHENKANEVHSSPPAAKTPEKTDKPKDLSPVKPTSNGVEEPPPKSSATEDVKPEVKPDVKPPPAPVTQPKQNENSVETPAPAKTEPSEKPAPVPASSSDEASTPAAAAATVAPSAPSPKLPTEGNDAVPGNEAPPAAAKNQSQTSTSSRKNKDDSTAEATPPAKRKRQKPVEVENVEEQPKTKRIRSQVIHFQSPLPELTTFINRSLKEPKEANKTTDDKLIVFYKNEFLAVRNAEGGFYICQALQNVYRTSHRIRIKWLSKEQGNSNTDGDIYIPDFYDLTDFECILTTVALEKLEKNTYKLPKIELERTENILKRALDVEKGVVEKPPVTEEHPDGIDLSIYKDESQLQKSKKSLKRKKESTGSEGSPKAKVKTPEKPQPKKTKKIKKKTVKKAAKADKSVKKPVGKTDKSSTKEVEQLKGSPPNEKARVVAKVLRKVDVTPVKESPPKKSTKHKAGKASKSKEVKKSSKKVEKTAPVPTTSTSKSNERRAIAATSRKKSGRK